MALPVLHLPGMMCDARLWWPQIAALSGHVAVHCAPITRGETIEEIAAGVLAEAPPVFALAGLSMGGSVAMEILCQAPDRVDRIALFDTNCQPELPNVAAEREPQIIAAKTGRFEEALASWFPPDYLAPGPARLHVANILRDMGLALGPEVFIRQSRAQQKRADQQPTLRKARLPALIVCGAHDTLTPPRRHEFMSHLMPNARLEIIAEAGHLPPLETPDQVTELLAQWLSG